MRRHDPATDQDQQHTEGTRFVFAETPNDTRCAMSFLNATKLGNGIIKTSSRPMTLVVDAQGEYWVCDANVDQKGDLRRQGCISYSERPFSEGG